MHILGLYKLRWICTQHIGMVYFLDTNCRGITSHWWYEPAVTPNGRGAVPVHSATRAIGAGVS
jgi:hypothetical protein